MRILHEIAELAEIQGPTILAVGVFDGLHLGHQAVLNKAMSFSGEVVALTFDPHPAKILRPASAPHLLTATPHKLRLMEDFGLRNVLVVRFDEAFARMAAEDFVMKLVAASSPLVHVCIGENWIFGHARKGNAALLRRLGSEHGFATTEVTTDTVEGTVVSSTAIRALVEAGELKKAGTYLGRDYSCFGTVQHGAGLGRELGYPTANVAAHNEQFPPNGVYPVRAQTPYGAAVGVANIGIRPTVATTNNRLLEVHLLDFDRDLYGHDIEVFFEDRLRPEITFESIDKLREQISLDVAAARQLFSTRNARH